MSALMGRIPLVDGPEIREYERKFGEAAGTKYAFSFASGRMALYVILEALGIGPDDEVIIPAFTCVVVPNAIIYRGARPIYVDIQSSTYNIDVTKIEEKIGSRTRAILTQHTFGLVSDVDAILGIAQRYGLVVIEDCAHALGATYHGRKAGSLGRVSYFSTDHSKIISTSTGGMIATNDHELADKIARLQERTPFPSQKRIRKILLTFALEYLLFHPRMCFLGTYIHSIVSGLGLWAYFDDELRLTKPVKYPYPARLSNAQARIGISQLDMLSENLAWRRKLARMYETQIGALGELLEKDYSNHAFLRYTFLVNDRAVWVKHLDGILDMGVWFRSIAHGRDYALHEIGYQPGSCPIAEEVTRHCVNLPTHRRITHPDLLVDLIKGAGESKHLGLRRPARMECDLIGADKQRDSGRLS